MIHLLKPMPDLDSAYDECVRNLTSTERMMLESHPILPEEYQGEEHFKIHRAHELYAQIQARKEGVTP